jgi:hypothetical protein
MADRHETTPDLGGAPAFGSGVHHHYGHRPALVGRRLHWVLPGSSLDDYRGHPTADAWCGQPAYLCEGLPLLDYWRGWPACLDCIPGCEAHAILEHLAAGSPEGMTAQELCERLDVVPVHPRLVAMLDRGYVVRGPGPRDQFSYRLSDAAAWYREQPR